MITWFTAYFLKENRLTLCSFALWLTHEKCKKITQIYRGTKTGLMAKCLLKKAVCLIL